MLLMVPYETPWAVAESLTLTQQSSFNIGGDGSDNVQGPHCLFHDQVLLIIDIFGDLNFLKDAVNSHFRQGLVP
jgi:hypothetical protein